MTVELVSITLAFGAPTLAGTLMLRHDDPGEEIEAELHQVDVQQVNVLPGYELITPDGDLVPDSATDPVGREAHRLMRMLLMPTSEAAAREAAVRKVLSTGFLVVLDDVDVWRTHLVAFMKGEITRDQLGWLAENTSRLAASPAPVVEPRLNSSIPQQWWDAANDRMRRHDLESSVTQVQAANMLGWTEDDLQHAVDEDRLATILSDGDIRVSRWQFEADFDTTTPGSHQLIPGVDIILVVVPRQARDGRTLGQWMTTPHPALLLDREPVSPRTWLRARNPLIDVITALTSIR